MNNHLVNEEIKVGELICIDSNKENLGLMKLEEALNLADKENLDLVLFNEKPAIAKIIDYKKFLYEESKKNKKQKVITNKEIQFGLNIAEHDLDIKIKKIKDFIEKKHPVLIKVQLKGREMQHPENGFELINKVLEKIKDLVKIEKKPELKGRNITIFLK